LGLLTARQRSTQALPFGFVGSSLLFAVATPRVDTLMTIQDLMAIQDMHSIDATKPEPTAQSEHPAASNPQQEPRHAIARGRENADQ